VLKNLLPTNDLYHSSQRIGI